MKLSSQLPSASTAQTKTKFRGAQLYVIFYRLFFKNGNTAMDATADTQPSRAVTYSLYDAMMPFKSCQLSVWKRVLSLPLSSIDSALPPAPSVVSREQPMNISFQTKLWTTWQRVWPCWF